MDFAIDFGGDPEDVTIVLSGTATARDFQLLTDALVSDPRFRAGLLMLVDVSALSTSGVLESEADAVASVLLERDWHYPPTAVAIVAPDDQTFEAVRLARARLGGSKSRRRIFRSREQAVAWLRDESKQGSKLS